MKKFMKITKLPAVALLLILGMSVSSLYAQTSIKDVNLYPVNGLLQLNFSLPVRDSYRGSGTIKLFVENLPAEIITITSPGFSEETLARIDDPIVIIKLTSAQQLQVTNWYQWGSMIKIDVPTGIFQDFTGILFNEINNFPVYISTTSGTETTSIPDASTATATVGPPIIKFAQYSEELLALRLEFEQSIDDSKTNPLAQLRLFNKAGNQSMNLIVPWANVSPNPNDNEVGILLSANQALMLGDWITAGVDLRIEVPANTFFSLADNSLGNISFSGVPVITGSTVTNPDTTATSTGIYLEHAEYESTSGSIKLFFNKGINDSLTSRTRLIRIHTKQANESLTLNLPWQHDSIDIPGDRWVAIDIPQSDIDVLENWSGFQYDLQIDLGGETFTSFDGMKNSEYNNYHVKVININQFHITYTSYNGNENILFIEWNKGLNDDATNFNGNIILHTYNGDTLMLTKPWSDINPAVNDPQMMIKLTDADAMTLELMPSWQTDLRMSIEAGVWHSMVTNEASPQIYDMYVMNIYNTIPADDSHMHVKYSYLNLEANQFHLMFNRPVDISSIDYNGSLRLWQEDPVQTMNIPTPWSIVTDSAGESEVIIALTDETASTLKLWPNLRDKLRLDLEPGIFHSTLDTLSNMDQKGYYVEYREPYINMDSALSLVYVVYHPGNNSLTLNFNKALNDAFTIKDSDIILHTDDTVNTVILSRPWEDISPTLGDHEVIIPVNDQQATIIEAWPNVIHGLRLTMNADNFKALDNTGNIPAYSYPVWFGETGSPHTNDNIHGTSDSGYIPIIIHDNNGFTNNQNLKISIYLPEFVTDMKISLSDTTNSTWITYDSSYSLDLGTSEGLKIIFMQFRDVKGEMSEWIIDTTVYDKTTPELSFPLENKYTLSQWPAYLPVTLTDALSGPAHMAIQMMRESDNTWYTGEGWNGAVTDTGRINSQSNWRAEVPVSDLQPGYYVISYAGYDNAGNHTPWQSHRLLISGDSTTPTLTGTENVVPKAQIWQEDKLEEFSLIIEDLDEGDSVILVPGSLPEYITLKSESASAGTFTFTFSVLPLQEHAGSQDISIDFTDKSGRVLNAAIKAVIETVNDKPQALLLSPVMSGGAFKTGLGVDDEDGTLATTSFEYSLKNISGTIIVPRSTDNNTPIYYPLPDGQYIFQAAATDQEGLSQQAPVIHEFEIKGITSMTFEAGQWLMISVLAPTISSEIFGSNASIARWQDDGRIDKIYNRYVVDGSVLAFNRGSGYWLQLAQTVTLITQETDLLDTSTTLSLIHGATGWNQVGNPYPYPIDLSHTGLTFFAWDAATADWNTGSVLQPGAAYWVNVNETIDITLNPDPWFKPVTAAKLAKTNIFTGSNNWSVKLSINAGKYRDAANIMGVTNSQYLQKAGSISEPPKMGPNINLSFLGTNSDSRLSTDYRSNINSKEEWWDLVITNNSTGHQSARLQTVEFQDLAANGQYAFLVNSESALPLYKASVVDIPMSGTDTYYSIVTSTDPSFPERLNSKAAQSTNYPNPITSSTTFRFQLPYKWHGNGRRSTEHYQLSFQIYDMLGNTVISNMPESFMPGAHSLHWIPVDNAGKRLTAGQYLYHINGAKISFSGKLLIL